MEDAGRSQQPGRELIRLLFLCSLRPGWLPVLDRRHASPDVPQDQVPDFMGNREALAPRW